MSIDEQFKKTVEANKGCAVIMAGSGSDDKAKEGEQSHIEKIADSLEKYDIPYQVRIMSAHKQPIELVEEIKSYNGLRGALTIIAVAGGTDALSGTASYHSIHPVISCPPDAAKYPTGINETCLQNPPGSCNAYIKRPENVGKFIAQMYSQIWLLRREKLEKLDKAKIDSLVKDDVRIMKKYAERQRGEQK